MKGALLLAALLMPGTAMAQVYHCDIPAALDRPHPELPSADQPQRVVPIGGYTLAITWAPQYCHGHEQDRSAAIECGGGNRFGFTLHGLWPDGVGKEWPQYCRATALLPAPLVRAHLCSTPSVQLLQHEWAKHGTCMAGLSPAAYFGRSTSLYGKLRFPDMDAMSRRSADAGDLAAAFAGANPGMAASMVRVTANRQGWLDEIWLCLDKALHYTRCRPDSGGLPASTPIRIWRAAP